MTTDIFSAVEVHALAHSAPRAVAAAEDAPAGCPTDEAHRISAWLKSNGRSVLNAKANGDDLELAILGVIGGYWDGVSARSVRDALERHKDARSIRVLIDSPGGDYFDGVAIMNQLKRHPATVTCEIIGEASSAASVIAMAGDSIDMHTGTAMMIHRAWTIAGGTGDELRGRADMLDKVDAGLVGIYCARTGKKPEEIRALVDATTWMTPAEAIELGFADSELPALPKRPASAPERSETPREDGADDAGARGARSRIPQSRAAAMATSEPPPRMPGQTSGNGEEDQRMDPKVLAKLLGLPETATESEIKASLEQRLTAPAVTVSGVRLLGVANEQEATAKIQSYQRAVLQLIGETGKATAEEAMAVVLEWKGKAEQAESLTKQLASITEEARVARRDAAIERLSREGVLPPARHEWARAQFPTAEAVESFCAGMPKGFFAAVREPDSGAAAVTLSPEEQAICKQLGMTEDKYLEEKKRLLGNGV